MSSLQTPERPIFNSIEPGLETDLAPPVSGLAVLALVLGFFSLTAALSTNIMPFAVLVAIFCVVLIWKLSRDSSISGVRLAQVGLCFAVVGSAWGVAATRTTQTYKYSNAQAHAKTFLEILASGDVYNAFELSQPEPDRQVTGTDVEAHYKALLESDLPGSSTMMAMPPTEEMPSGETMKSSRAKEDLEEFLTSSSNKEIMTHGKEAKWEFVRGAGIARISETVDRISVVMVDTNKPTKKFQVDLNRVVGRLVAKRGTAPVAIWDIDRTRVVKE